MPEANAPVQIGWTMREFYDSELRAAKAVGKKRGEVTCRNHGTQWVRLARVFGKRIFTDTGVHGLDDSNRTILLVCSACRRAWEMDRQRLGRALNRTSANRKLGGPQGPARIDVEEIATHAVISVS